MVDLCDLRKKEENKEKRSSILDLLRPPNDNIAIFLEVPGLNGGSGSKLIKIAEYLGGGDGIVGLLDEGDGKDIPTIYLGIFPRNGEEKGRFANRLGISRAVGYKAHPDIFLNNEYVRRKILIKKYGWS